LHRPNARRRLVLDDNGRTAGAGGRFCGAVWQQDLEAGIAEQAARAAAAARQAAAAAGTAEAAAAAASVRRGAGRLTADMIAGITMPLEQVDCLTAPS